MYRQGNKGNNQNPRKNNFDVKAVQASMKQDLIDVGDAIVSKIVRFENVDESEKESEDATDSKSSKKRVKSGGIGDFLSKRGKRE